MSYPAKMPCPNCGVSGKELGVYTYDNGARHVECNNCHYLGPGAGSILQAIKSHNERSLDATAAIQGIEHIHDFTHRKVTGWGAYPSARRAIKRTDGCCRCGLSESMHDLLIGSDDLVVKSKQRKKPDAP